MSAKKAEGRSFGLLFKDWITLCLSVLAFVFSIMIGYYVTIRQKDDLRVVVSSLPDLDFDLETNLGTLSEDKMTLVFINSGTRPAIVLGVQYIISEKSNEPREVACWGPRLI